MLKDLLQTLADALMDTFEDFFESFTMPTGKNLVLSFIVLLIFLVYTVLSLFLPFPNFIQWQEALMAVVIVGAVCLIDVGNRSAIKEMSKQLKSVVVKYKEVEDDD